MNSKKYNHFNLLNPKPNSETPKNPKLETLKNLKTETSKNPKLETPKTPKLETPKNPKYIFFTSNFYGSCLDEVLKINKDASEMAMDLLLEIEDLITTVYKRVNEGKDKDEGKENCKKFRTSIDIGRYSKIIYIVQYLLQVIFRYKIFEIDINDKFKNYNFQSTQSSYTITYDKKLLKPVKPDQQELSTIIDLHFKDIIKRSINLACIIVKNSMQLNPSYIELSENFINVHKNLCIDLKSKNHYKLTDLLYIFFCKLLYAFNLTNTVNGIKYKHNNNFCSGRSCPPNSNKFMYKNVEPIRDPATFNQYYKIENDILFVPYVGKSVLYKQTPLPSGMTTNFSNKNEYPSLSQSNK